MGWIGKLSTNEIQEKTPIHVVESPTFPGEPVPALKVGDTIPVEYVNNTRDDLDVLEVSDDGAVVRQKNGTKWKMSHVKPGEMGSSFDSPGMNSQDWIFRTKLP